MRLTASRLFLALAAASVLALLPAAPGSAVGAPVFGPPQVLPGQGGGEPSLAIDLTNSPSRNSIYVEAIGGWGANPPPGDPAGSGPVLWHSYDAGATWSQPVPFDTVPWNASTRGGDGDVVVDARGNVIVTDLNVSYAWVQVSTDRGRTFNTGTATAFEDDRPWLTAAGAGTVYVYYHDFVAEVPTVCTSTDGGHTFTTCSPFTLTTGSVVSNCAENTVPARPLVVDSVNRTLDILYSCSSLTENLQHPPYGPLHDYYLAQSSDGGLTWNQYPVFVADTSGGKQPNYANIFSTLGIDSAGNYYVVFAGTPDDPNVATNPYHVYLVTSTDHGHTWSAPKQVDHDANGAGTHTQPHFVATTAGNLDIAWYGTTATGEPNGACGTVVAQSPCPSGFPNYTSASAPAWHVYMAQTANALDAVPAFTQVRASTTPVHYGQICTNGIVCGSSDRSLLDFLSLGVDCLGNAHIAYATNTPAEEAADFTSGGANIAVVNQTAGSTIGAPAACSAPPPGPTPTPTPGGPTPTATPTGAPTPTPAATPTAGPTATPAPSPSPVLLPFSSGPRGSGGLPLAGLLLTAAGVLLVAAVRRSISVEPFRDHLSARGPGASPRRADGPRSRTGRDRWRYRRPGR